jgi:hypothetical protein
MIKMNQNITFNRNSETISINISFFCAYHERKGKKNLLAVVKTYKRKSTNQVKTLNTKVIEEMGDTSSSTVIDG